MCNYISLNDCFMLNNNLLTQPLLGFKEEKVMCFMHKKIYLPWESR